MQPANPDDVLVTALIITYNHERYIRGAIESALMQETTFKVEILISEDASTDGTRQIVRDYAEKYPDRIRTILSEVNLRSNRTVARGLDAARGRFVCLLDGDDLWTSRSKLQMQADYLLAHPETAAHFLNATIIQGEEVTDRLWTPVSQPRRLDMAAIWEGNPFATAGGMMRTELVRGVPEWYDGFFPRTDWPLYILCAMSGYLDFDPEPAAQYRMHDGGLYRPLGETEKFRSTDAFYRRMDECLEGRFRNEAKIGSARFFFDWSATHLAAGRLGLAWDAWRRSLWGTGIKGGISRRRSARQALRLIGEGARFW